MDLKLLANKIVSYTLSTLTNYIRITWSNSFKIIDTEAIHLAVRICCLFTAPSTIRPFRYSKNPTNITRHGRLQSADSDFRF